MSLHLVVAEGVVQRRLWAAGDAVAVAVSGGLDSVCLMYLLARSAGVHGGRLSVVTLDHGQREGSADDVAFVVDQARGLGLPVVAHRLELATGASEAEMRAARRRVLDELPVARVALAHHRDDQAETAVLGWLRGGGTRALAGMAWRSGRYVRPLLALPREALRTWALGVGLAWREDPSNRDPRFLRNRVRGELLPLAEALRPGAARALARGAGLAAEDDALLEHLSVEVERSEGGLTRRFVAEGAGPLVRRALLRRWPTATAAQLDALVVAARRGGGVVGMSEGVMVVVDRDGVRTKSEPVLPGAPGPIMDPS